MSASHHTVSRSSPSPTLHSLEDLGDAERDANEALLRVEEIVSRIGQGAPPWPTGTHCHIDNNARTVRDSEELTDSFAELSILEADNRERIGYLIERRVRLPLLSFPKSRSSTQCTAKRNASPPRPPSTSLLASILTPQCTTPHRLPRCRSPFTKVYRLLQTPRSPPRSRSRLRLDHH